MDVNSITYEKLKEICSNKGFVFFEELPYDLNIIGIRTSDMTPNVFNDYVCVAYKDANFVNRLLVAEATTDPGLYWMQSKEMNTKGAAIVKEGQYRGVWQIGKHQGKYTALVQRGDITVYRDANRDAKYDLDPAKTETGVFGINLHRAKEGGKSFTVDMYSAGCIVVSDSAQFDKIISLCQKQLSIRKGKTFTFTLINESDF